VAEPSADALWFLSFIEEVSRGLARSGERASTSLPRRLCALSERVSLSVTERDVPGPWPRTTIAPGLEYLGMPAGYELTTLVHGIVEAGRAAPSVSELTRERLQELQHDVKVDVYVTPT